MVLSAVLEGSANGRTALSDAETRLDANLALNAIAFSASATGSRGGSVGGIGVTGAGGVTVPLGCIVPGAPFGCNGIAAHRLLRHCLLALALVRA